MIVGSLCGLMNSVSCGANIFIGALGAGLGFGGGFGSGLLTIWLYTFTGTFGSGGTQWTLGGVLQPETATIRSNGKNLFILFILLPPLGELVGGEPDKVAFGTVEIAWFRRVHYLPEQRLHPLGRNVRTRLPE